MAQQIGNSTGRKRRRAVERLGSVESHGIDFIPDEHRTSKPMNIFWILIGANLTFGLIVLGTLPVIFGLSWWSSVSSILVGCFFGALLLAPMALIGPRTGTNGPVSSGAYFGVVGRIIGSALALFIALGFYALAVWTGGQIAVYGAHSLFGLPSGNLELGISYAIVAIIAITAALYGHAKMLMIEKLLIPTAGLLLIVGFFVYGGSFNVHYHGGEYALGSYWSTWALAVTIAAAATFGYGPFVNDWARYISPRRHSDRSVFMATFAGGFVGLSLPFIFGAFTMVAINNPAAEYVSGLVEITPTGYLVPLILIGIVGSLGQSTVCIYSNGLDFSSIFPILKRTTATALLSFIGVAFIFLGTLVWNVESTVSAFVSLFGVFAASWITISVVGHYSRRGYYDPDALQVFNRRERGGIYWFTHGFNLRACFAWLVACTVGGLALNTSLYEGPLSNVANGIDLSWISSAVIGAVLYFVAIKLFPEPAGTRGPVRQQVRTGAIDPVQVLATEGVEE